MALEVGAVYASAGVKVDESGFRGFANRLDRARRDAHDGLEAHGGLNVDESGFRRFRRELDDGERHAGRFSIGVRKHMGDVRLGIAGAAGAGVVALGGLATAAVGVAASFQKQMAEVQAVTGASRKELERLSDAAIDAGAKSGLGARKAAAAITELAKGGLDTATILGGGLAGAMSLAAAGGLELADAASTTANALNLFHLQGDQATHVADAFATAANATTADVSDFALALSQGGSAAKAAGLTFDDTTVALEALAANGVKGSDAGTSLKSALTQLANPTKQAKDELKKLNLSFFDSHGNIKPLVQISGELRDKLGGLSKQQRLQVASTLAGTDGMRALLALYDTGPKRLDKFGDGLKKHGTAADVAKAKQAGLSGAIKRLQAAGESLAISAGKTFLPALTHLADKTTKFVDEMRKGEGTGGRFADKLEDVWKSVKHVGDTIGDVAGDVKDHIGLIKKAGEMWAIYWLAVKGKSLAGRLSGIPKGPAGAIGGAVASTKPIPVYVVNEGFGGGRGGPLGGGIGGAGGTVGKLGRVKGVLKGAGKLGAELAAVDVAVNLVDTRGNPIAALINSAHDLTFGITPKVKVPTSAQRQDKQLEDMKKRLEDAFNAPSVKPLQDARREIKLMADESDKFGRHDLAKRWRDLEDTLRHSDDAFKGSRQNVRELNDRVDEAAGKYRAAKAPLKGLEKGTDAYRIAAKVAKDRQRDLNDALHDARKVQGPAARTFATIAGSVAGMGAVVADTLDSVGGNVNKVLGDLGAKTLKYTIKHPKAAGHDVGALASALSALGGGNATGGIPHPGSGGRDDHILVAPDGRPVAAMSGTEGILNTPQMGEVDRALAITSALGLGRFGGLGELWGSGMRHYATGGSIVPVPGFPGESAASSVIPAIESIAHRFHLTLTDAYGQGHKSPGHTKTGTAADFAGPDRNMDAAVKSLVASGYLVGYDGRFGSKAWPGHGPTSVAGGNAHLHVELGGKGGSFAGAIAELVAPRIAGPASALRTIGQKAANRVTGAANKYLGRQAGSILGAPVAGGGSSDEGVISGFRRAFRVTNANAVERLAGWEAGIVESGLKNLPGGDADSEGALQERVSIYGRAHARSPFASMVRFVRDAIKLRPWRGSAGMLAAAVQRPAAQFRGRYDAVRNQAAAYMARGGLLPRFAGGGSLDSAIADAGLGAGGSNERHGPYTIRALKGVAGDRVDHYSNILKDVDRLRKQYDQADRRYNQTDEVLIDPATGALNQPAIEHRAGELGALLKIRQRIVRKLEEAEKVAKRVRATYKTIINRLTRSLRHAKKKDRSGIRAQIKAYQGKRKTWLDTIRDDVHPDVIDARLDVGDIQKEANELRGTKAEPQDAATDTGTADTADDSNAQAIATQATARANALAQQLATARQNLAVFTGPGDLGSGGSSAWAAGTFAGAAGTDPMGAATGGSFGRPAGPGGVGGIGAGGTNVTVEVHSFVPPSGAEAHRLAAAVVGALDAQGSVQSPRERLP